MGNSPALKHYTLGVGGQLRQPARHAANTSSGVAGKCRSVLLSAGWTQVGPWYSLERH